MNLSTKSIYVPTVYAVYPYYILSIYINIRRVIDGRVRTRQRAREGYIGKKGVTGGNRYTIRKYLTDVSGIGKHCAHKFVIRAFGKIYMPNRQQGEKLSSFIGRFMKSSREQKYAPKQRLAIGYAEARKSTSKGKP